MYNSDVYKLFVNTGMSCQAIAEELNLSGNYLTKIRCGEKPLTDNIKNHLVKIIRDRECRRLDNRDNLIKSLYITQLFMQKSANLLKDISPQNSVEMLGASKIIDEWLVEIKKLEEAVNNEH